ncbi:hypothetical protein DPMN_004245 [Dreissena polymorpha]|uniref:Uncharacterized protein n=1 Tax=Dreissena polymorpha TaxID=45954 RepID=A0A9D4MSB3_DREPO|nr:hypothetical protein DPMN_004245 [Dreissena polymorpha]
MMYKACKDGNPKTLNNKKTRIKKLGDQWTRSASSSTSREPLAAFNCEQIQQPV